jgi:deoxyribodipyrimidine photo-lyase
MSVHLKYGAVHPRTLLADLAGHSGDGAATVRTELAWREFYADVLWHHPESARENFDRRYDALPWDSGADADAHFEAWAQGRTASRSSTPGCASCARRPGCTTGSG